MAMDHILIVTFSGIRFTDKLPLTRKSRLRYSLLKRAVKIRKVKTKVITATYQFQVIFKEK